MDEGYNQVQISQKLGVPRSTVGYIDRKYRKNGSIKRISGRPYLLENNETQLILGIIEKFPKTSAEKLTNIIE